MPALQSPSNVPQVIWTPKYGRGWRVYWPTLGGYHGGVHVHYLEAVDHAGRLMAEDRGEVG